MSELRYHTISAIDSASLTILPKSFAKLGHPQTEVMSFSDFDTLVGVLSKERNYRSKTDLPLALRGECQGGRHKSDFVGPILVVLDVDDQPISVDECAARIEDLGLSAFLHTTWRHVPDSAADLHRFRVYLDLVCDDWEAVQGVTEWLSEALEIELDGASYHGAGFFLPTNTPRGRCAQRVVAGNGTECHIPLRPPRIDSPAISGEVGTETPVDIEELRSALWALGNDDFSYDRWLETGMSIHSARLEAGEELWCEWSALSDKDEPEVTAAKWSTFDADRVGGRTWRSIFDEAYAVGWRPPVPSAAEDFAELAEAREILGEDLDAEPDDEPVKRGPGRPRKDDKHTPRKIPKADLRALDQLDEQYAYVAQGNGRVVDLHPKNPDDSFYFLKPDAFKRLYVDEIPTGKVDSRGNSINVAISKFWLDHWEHTPRYDRVTFLPEGSPRVLPEKTLNLWRGFPFEPGPGSCGFFWEHVYDVVCRREQKVFEWVETWLAHLVQKPWEKPGTAIVLRSGEGTGKGVFASKVSKLCGAHGITVHQAKHLTGAFNAQLTDKIFACADEVTWGGRKQDSGAMKALITEHSTITEPKGIDAARGNSFLRLMILGNEHWLIDAGVDARRFCVLDVDPKHTRESAYFDRIEDSFNENTGKGYRALMRHLLDIDLRDRPSVREAPETAALLDQKHRSLNHIEAWALDLATAGLTPGEGTWKSEVATSQLYESYLAFEKNRRYQSEPVPRVVFGKFLSGELGLKFKFVRDPEGRSRGYVLGELKDFRGRIDGLLGQPFEWQDGPVEEEDATDDE